MRKQLLSPIGERIPLQKIDLEGGLVAYQCSESGGIYIPLTQYWSWLRKQPAKLDHLPESTVETAVDELDHGAFLCPETNTIMLRYRVGHGFKFTIDRSQTGGVWLDKGEWEELKQRQFNDELHLVFTAPWQRNVRKRIIAQHTEERMKQRMGEELFTEMTLLKAKLADHAYRDYVIAFLDE